MNFHISPKVSYRLQTLVKTWKTYFFQLFFGNSERKENNTSLEGFKPCLIDRDTPNNVVNIKDYRPFSKFIHTDYLEKWNASENEFLLKKFIEWLLLELYGT